jgi:hypothetical protein
MKTFIAVCVLILAGAAPSAADVNIINPNFLTDSSTLVPGFQTVTTIPGWTVGQGTNVDWVGTYWSAPTANGGYPGGGSVDLDGTNSAGSISQQISTVAQQVYTLSFYAGANPDGPPDPFKNLLVTVNGATPGFKGFQPPITTPSIEGGGPNGLMAWTLETYSFTANAGTATISFESEDSGFGNTDPNNISFGPVIAGVSVVTPEPGFYAALGLGLAGLVLRRSWRRRSA